MVVFVVMDRKDPFIVGFQNKFIFLTNENIILRLTGHNFAEKFLKVFILAKEVIFV